MRDSNPSVRLLALFFVGSGFSALAYQVVLSRYAQLIVGATAYAISALLVAFMLGMSLGAAFGGRWADRTEHPLRVYAVAEGVIGLYCLCFPVLFPYLTELYLALVPGIGEGSFVARNAVRFALGVSAFLVPTFFMGITTPAFARAVASAHEDSGAWLARLYGWNTLGASLGAITTAYVLVPKLGLVGSMLLATVINFSIAVAAFRHSKPVPRPGPPETVSVIERNVESAPLRRASRPLGLAPFVAALLALGLLDVFSEGIDVLRWALASFYQHGPRIAVTLVAALVAVLAARNRGHVTIQVLLLAAFASGFLSFALEIIWTHLLAILLGNSVYAFGLMLGSLLLGLAIGSLLARRLASRERRAANWIGLSLAVAGVSVLLTLELWDEIPALFLAFARASPSFALMEGVRFIVALGLMLLPTAAFGITFPLTLHCASAGRSHFGARVGQVYAINTVGAVLGAVSGPYILLPALGSLSSLELLGSLLLVTGGLAISAIADFSWRPVTAAVAITALLWAPALPVSWDFNALNMAAAVYLGDSASAAGQILYQREDATGGLTSVVEERGVRTLLTNGKFQGDNAEEIPIQHRAANIPTLFTAGRERAFAIGLGTGVTLAALAAHGFEEVVCAELSGPIVEGARRYFSDVNGNILDRSNLRLVPEDGRSVLFESFDRYDVITVEVSSIWFAGVGAIYSREFYEHAKARLRRNGVLLQWFPIHHLSARNLFLVVNTVRAVFPHVSLWNHRHQAFVVASNEPLEVDLDSVRADRARLEMAPYLRELPSGSPLELLSDLVVKAEDMDRFLDSMSVLLRTRRSVVSTDTWPTLEYETPKDILENFSYFQNRETFRRFRSIEPPAFRGVPTERESLLASTAFVKGWRDPRALARLALLWRDEPELSEAASLWLYDELTGEDAFGTSFSSDPVEELRAALPALDSMIAGSRTRHSCEPIPRFLSRLARAPLLIEGHTGESLDGTEAADAIDGIFDPELGNGWRVRPDGRPVRLDLRLDRATALEAIHLVVRPVDGAVVRTRVLGRDPSGAWLPLASGSQTDEVLCEARRSLRLSASVPDLEGIRVELEGEGSSFRVALHEIWVEARRGRES